MTITIKKGLNIPIQGEPQPHIEDAEPINTVALLGVDYPGLKPTIAVQEGDAVKLGQLLFTDKKNPAVRYTAPGAGTIKVINRGAKRALQSVVIQLDGNAEETFEKYTPDELPKLSSEAVQANLLASGLWTSLRTRPFDKVPNPETQPQAIFVNAMDTQPLAADPQIIIQDYPEAFKQGLTVLSRLTQNPIFVCHAANAKLPVVEAANIAYQSFAGPHPAGLVGTHIHYLAPVSPERTVWHLNYQDAIAIGKLFTTGRLWVERIIALAGPMVKQPRLVRTRLGASTEQLVAQQLYSGDVRIISGSVLSGRRVADALAYLGRYHLQLSVLSESRERQFLGWINPDSRKRFSVMRVLLPNFAKDKKLALNTQTNGSPRAMVPIGNYEKIMPLDILPTQLLRALVVNDTDQAQQLGCLELTEEDLALCTFVSHSKYDYGRALRRCLTQIEQEG